MSDARRLPARPNLGQYRKLAKDLREAGESGNPDAIRQWALRWLDKLERQDPGASTQRTTTQEAERIAHRWQDLRDKKERVEPCTLADAQFFLAREHGFASWPKFARHVRELGRANSSVSAFEAAADAIVAGDVQALRNLLATYPGLVRERSTREHRSTLLHYVSANGVEDFRQKTPKNIIDITNLLLDSGSDVNAASEAYGGGCTALGLVATSIHPERAGVQIPLLRVLVDRGANFVPPGTGAASRSIIQGCLANGQLESARFFANLGVALDLEGAAALGRVDVLRTLFGSEEDQRRPDWKEVESAFLHACGYGSRAAAEFLLERGVDPAVQNSEGQTALHWASYGPHLEVIKLLLERGAPVDVRDCQFHATPMDVTLWIWQNDNNKKEARERCYDAVGLLSRAGARFDPDHWKSPGEERSRMLEKIASDTRMRAALRGESSGG